MSKNLYTTGDVAKIFGVSIPTVRKWAPYVPHVKTFSNHIYFDTAAIEQMKQQMQFPETALNYGAISNRGDKSSEHK